MKTSIRNLLGLFIMTMPFATAWSQPHEVQDHAGHVHSPAMPAGGDGSAARPPGDDADHVDHAGHDSGHGAPQGDPESGRHRHQQGGHDGHHASGAPLDLPHTRWSSGTAWQPDSTPMYGHHFQAGGWRLMLHESLHFGYDHQGSDRGSSKAMSTNWVMGMAEHALWGGVFGVRAMLSLEPLTAGDDGYPLLLQTGETLGGMLLHDRQHPHDLFMEVALTYRRALNDWLGFEVYAAPSGEPALGPTAFPHRVSAMSDPLAPISHHWQDSTHISFGVVTMGVFTRTLKLEGSWFNGKEPDEDRYDFDFAKFDSASGRLSYNPSPSWSLQTSYGYLSEPEALEPGVSISRVTSSVMFNRPMKDEGNLAVTLAWGRNIPSHGSATDALLLEANYNVDGHSVPFGRFEVVRKNGHELALPESRHDEPFTVLQLAIGYAYMFSPLGPIVPGLGVRTSVAFIPEELKPFYGTNTPAGVMVFLHLRPRPMEHH